MLESWLTLVDGVLRPARPHLERCLEERERHLGARRLIAEEQARALANCTGRIEAARADVFSARDGVVPARMTELEREWRTLSRSDPDGGLMDLWARVAPGSWIDRKRWRDGDAATRLDLAIALAADVEGVETAEAAIGALRAVLTVWEIPIGARIRFRPFEHDVDSVPDLLAKPLLAANETLATRDGGLVVVARARKLEQAVHEAALVRFPERPLLARGLGHAAFADCVFRATSLAPRGNPVPPLCEIWRAGYVLSAIDASGVTVEIPPLGA